tara:strand:- start:1266 stop:1931 length:666 start_codon:yes stop_codon:yes gene_type:complete
MKQKTLNIGYLRFLSTKELKKPLYTMFQSRSLKKITKPVTLLLFIGMAWGQAEAEKFVKSSRANVNQQNSDNYNITASSKEYFKERSISKLKTTNENYGRGSIVKANDYQIRFIAKPKLFYRGGAYLIDIESIEEITLVPENYGKLLKIISNLSIPGTYCFTLLVNIWSDTAHIEALVMTMIPLAAKGLLSFAQGKKNTIKMSNWDEAMKIVYFEDLLSKQ